MDRRMRTGREGGSLPGRTGGKTIRMMTATRADTRISTKPMAGRPDIQPAVRSAGLQRKSRSRDGPAGRMPLNRYRNRFIRGMPMERHRNHPVSGMPMERHRNHPGSGMPMERRRKHPGSGMLMEQRVNPLTRQEAGSQKREEKAVLSCGLFF